jgi:Domain of unknown function (DUF4440)
MRNRRLLAAAAVLLSTRLACAQKVPTNPPAPEPKQSVPTADAKLSALLESKVKQEWEAFRTQNKKQYADLLTDDFLAVEGDREGARPKGQAVAEIEKGLVSNYTLFSFKAFALCDTSAFVRYEVTIQFQPKLRGRLARIYVTEIWLKQGNEWKCWHYQETSVK